MDTPINIAIALVPRNGCWLVAQRRAGTHLAGCWEFPGGKIHDDETPAQAAMRELREECGVTAVAEAELPPIEHTYADRRVCITPVVCRWIAGEGEPLASDACRWVRTTELASLDMPAANAPLLVTLSTLDQHANP